MKNPLIKLREERGLTIAELALVGNVSVITVQRLENGSAKTISNNLLAAIQKLGYEPEKFRINYEAWRGLKMKKIIEEKVIQNDGF
ncbi:helix-turn-helix domain-containing protein [Bacillus benzoevorans]|uniref:Transcriptional regulator with XRE-family HTH domain n=1 Tax=Bacillus benzoevorans TaxID=1456 RepID=A0A7X0LWD5_9BACI|nr:helix-turn-helix transcriptional regulator [Bacillus benzoevorans]MBB6446545.1 transcriptional regulator with XRE-family HTH domain [Bacillus benzoevorans]